MTLETVLVAVDGSEASLRAAQVGFGLLQPAATIVVVTVVEPSDPTLVVGTGLAGGVMSADELQEIEDARLSEARAHLDAALAALQVEHAESVIVRGDPGTGLCDLAEERAAAAIVMGSRGRGGIKRALLGSVSDYVVRNAPCPVVITRPPE
jgi:nucleotide-binding universal stress UspA family protein